MHAGCRDRALDVVDDRSVRGQHLHDAGFGVEGQLVVTAYKWTDRRTKRANLVLAIKTVNFEAQRIGLAHHIGVHSCLLNIGLESQFPRIPGSLLIPYIL